MTLCSISRLQNAFKSLFVAAFVQSGVVQHSRLRAPIPRLPVENEFDFFFSLCVCECVCVCVCGCMCVI